MIFSRFLLPFLVVFLASCTTTQSQNSSQAPAPTKVQTITTVSSVGSTNTKKSSNDAVYNSEHSCLDIDFSLLLVDHSVRDIEQKTEACLQNANVRYEFAQALFQKGFVEESLNQLQLIPNTKDKSSKLVLLETSDLVKRMDSPFVYAAEIANEKLERWLTRPSEVPEFNLKPPVRKNPPTPPVVVRSEFETSQEFNLRKRTIEKDYLNKISQLEVDYQKAIEDYNNNVEKYNASLEWEIRSRKERAEMMRSEFLVSEIKGALGKLLIENLNYNADEQIYYADLVSTESNYSTPIAIEIPLEEARDFKNDYQGIFPEPKFEITNGTISIADLNIPYKGQIYRALLTDLEFDFKPSREVISLKTMKDLNVDTSAPSEKILNNQININQIIKENRRYFQNVVN